MARARQAVVYIDTHIIVWLYAGLTEKLTEKAREAIEKSDIIISQIVRLELQYLYEIGRISVRPGTIINGLAKALDLKISKIPLEKIIDKAITINWTRDVFDRIIAAESEMTASGFITADRAIQNNIKHAIW